ncbi:MAG TPA: hypothetical protein PKX78_01185 [Candidatus Woesebacteria bacterium]|jgi:hypothetical protein|nr:hypothetical protein [Candidatus Woesebacteria bacterium]
MTEVVYTVIFVIGVTAFFSYLSFKQKKSSWEGVVVNKKEDTDDESGVTTYYVYFKTNSGKKKVNLGSSAVEYGKWNIGDKGIKKAGSFFPEK